MKTHKLADAELIGVLLSLQVGNLRQATYTSSFFNSDLRRATSRANHIVVHKPPFTDFHCIRSSVKHNKFFGKPNLPIV